MVSLVSRFPSLPSCTSIKQTYNHLCVRGDFVRMSSSTVSKSEYDARWFAMWQADKRPRFDQGKAAQSLMHLLNSGFLSVKGKRVLVPGCGTGYDVIAFAQAGADLSLGLDLASIAVDEAIAFRDSLALPPGVAEHTQFAVADFFTYEHPDGPFDVGYDYTFLCAMHPSLRADWARHWARMLKPGAELLALMFPVDASRDPQQGPPFPLTPELYKSLLEPLGFECTLLEPVPPERSSEARRGLEIMSRWTRK